MAISDMLNRRVRARPDDDEDVYSEESDAGQEVSQDEDGEQGDSDADLSEDDEKSQGSEHDEDVDDSNEDMSDDQDGDDDGDDIKASLSNISFGALAKAQASMGPKKRKEKQTKATEETASPLDDIRARIREAREQKREAAGQTGSKEAKDKKAAARASKHAPMVQSSKRAVSRKRMVIEPAAIAKARDPRFDAAVMGHSGAGKNPDAANKAYAFLDEYRASELKDLKAQLAKTKNEAQKEALKKQIRSATDQMRARESRKRERDVVAEHKKREKQAIREGKKSTPYYLKNSDLKKQVLQKKYEQMGSRERAKALERRRKKMASKERKDMPMERRGIDDAPPSRDGKRRRLA